MLVHHAVPSQRGHDLFFTHQLCCLTVRQNLMRSGATQQCLEQEDAVFHTAHRSGGMCILTTHHSHTDVCAPSKAAHHVSFPHQVCQPVQHHALHARVLFAPKHSCDQPQHSHRGQLIAACSSVSAETSVQLGWNVGFQSKFSLGPVLGAGSFGTVHEAVHKTTGNSYAVKVLHKSGKHGMQLDAISSEVETWRQAQLGSKYVARLEGLYEVGPELLVTS